MAIVSQNDFAIDLFDASYKGDTVVISPLCAAANLGLLVNAADGKTRAELLDALDYDDIAVLNSLNKKLLSNIEGLDSKKVKLSLVNSVWLNSALKVAAGAQFVKDAEGYYKASISQFAFDNQTYKVVNDWAYNKSNGLIKDFYSPNEINPNKSYFMMTNALYFKGEFAEKFDKAETTTARFYGNDDIEKYVYMMNDARSVPYLKNDKVQAVSLDFGSGVYDMVVAVPADGVSLADAAEEALSIDGNSKTALSLSMPKFQQETEFDLKEYFQKIGINAERANLGGITLNNAPISCANFTTKQKTVFSVDEDGAEGSSATSTNGADISTGLSFVADKPFVYMVREKSSGVILFIGAYVK